MIYEDKNKEEKSVTQIRALAFANIAASMGKTELIEFYVDRIDMKELIEWAQDDNGAWTG